MITNAIYDENNDNLREFKCPIHGEKMWILSINPEKQMDEKNYRIALYGISCGCQFKAHTPLAWLVKERG